ncbi:uncharacterized protein ACA1_088560 [Acanthamoeba castellanii str. Neff]|uniref:Uncharacterized protein n=1 Tax=Acanthamoeba castellanii (strain ATCC 30010 / Neff) TaxID=1257118 RepID=L8GX24_ACACF|nr:uncharacterized protein ACA1_088560 [Acanthamoeba castellanii str. Neff]ELR16611.1 hypothetical protein ACA1_088560 [Acanthamoeba castellanii str. Neff]
MYAHAPATTEAGMRAAYSSVSRELRPTASWPSRSTSTRSTAPPATSPRSPLVLTTSTTATASRASPSRIFASGDDDDDYNSRSIEEGDTLASQVGGAFYYGASH